MTRTARRRWTRELDSQIDGIAFGSDGPVILHCYDPPAGGKWLDDVIPGKLVALDRTSGEACWTSPCEIGYGRGFGAGFGSEDDIVMLGPGMHGHGIARMKIDTGEVIGAREIEFFDEALVRPDLCVCVTPERVFGLLTSEMVEAWVYAREGERYHMVARSGDLLYVVYAHKVSRRRGVLCLHAQTGDYAGELFGPNLGAVHGIVTGEQATVLVLEELEAALPPEALREYLLHLSQADEDADLSASSAGCHLVAMPTGASADSQPLWFESLGGVDGDDLPDISLGLDSGKLYVAQGAHLEVRDALTGRPLGEQTVPGLDEFVAWRVSNGAGLLAEETRASIFEVPD